jgi:hypothetical protein
LCLISTRAKIVAEVNGEKDEKRRRTAKYAAGCAAAGMGTATVLAVERREHGRLALLRQWRCTAAILPLGYGDDVQYVRQQPSFSGHLPLRSCANGHIN